MSKKIRDMSDYATREEAVADEMLGAILDAVDSVELKHRNILTVNSTKIVVCAAILTAKRVVYDRFGL